MSRRGNRGVRRGGGRRGRVDVPLLTQPFLAYRADFTNTATNFDLLDRTGHGHTQRQATGADKPTIVNPTEIGGRHAVRFDGLSDFLAAVDAAAQYTFLHNGSGMEVHLITIPRAIVASAYLFATQSASPYIALLHGGVASQLRLLVTNDAGAGIIDVNAPAALALNTPVRIGLSMINDGGSFEYDLRINNITAVSGGGVTFGSNPASAPLNIMRRPNGTGFAQHDLAECNVWNRVIAVSERSSLNSYYVDRYSFLV